MCVLITLMHHAHLFLAMLLPLRVIDDYFIVIIIVAFVLQIVMYCLSK